MADLPEPIKSVLRDYCHVEWFEISELADDVHSQRQRLDTALLKKQFESLITAPGGLCQLVNQLTANEFISDDEVQLWLEEIYEGVFSSGLE